MEETIYGPGNIAWVLGMSRGSTPRHAQTAEDLGLAVQFIAKTPRRIVPRETCNR